jgi:hypothetical protein
MKPVFKIVIPRMETITPHPWSEHVLVAMYYKNEEIKRESSPARRIADAIFGKPCDAFTFACVLKSRGFQKTAIRRAIDTTGANPPAKQSMHL